MIDSAIADFFGDRKTAWLKKNLKATMSELEVREKEAECDAVFTLSQWLPNAAKRAGQISISTHPCTFSHPSSRKNKNGYASSIIANSLPVNDGFLKSGSVKVGADALGNAAALDVYKFLMLVMEDGKTLIHHLEHDTELATVLLTLPSAEEAQNYQSLKQGFLAMMASDSEQVTSSKIKQVFFPVKEEAITQLPAAVTYHQLSILTASGLVFELRKRLDAMRFGDDIKAARVKRKNGETHSGYSEIYNLTTIGYGGTKPQNISVLNNQNGGKAHLLMCVPPNMLRRDIHFPHSDFFSQNVSYFHCKTQFYKLHKLYSRDESNRHIRAERDEYYQSVIDYIIEKMWSVRSVADVQYNPSTTQLPAAQKTWLCAQEDYESKRASEDVWLDDIAQSITLFLVHGYEKVLAKKAIKLGDAEYKHMKNLVFSNKEALR